MHNFPQDVPLRYIVASDLVQIWEHSFRRLLLIIKQDCYFSDQTANGRPAENDDDSVAICTPIATLVFLDGHTESVYEPLAGHEHLFEVPPMTSPQTSFGTRASNTHRPISLAPTQVPGKTIIPVLRLTDRSLTRFHRDSSSFKPRTATSSDGSQAACFLY